MSETAPRKAPPPRLGLRWPKRIALIAVALAALAGLAWFAAQPPGAPPLPDRLYGNIEIRQVDLAFNSEGTLIRLVKQEGDRVSAGEVIAALDPATYEDAARLATARRDAARAQLDKLEHGTRIEDIDQARANVAAAKASLANAEVSFTRQQGLVAVHASPQQEFDDARRALDTTRAQVALTQAALAEALAGPRVEDIAAARAQLRQAEASVGLAQTELSRTTLRAPCEGIVMTRVVEPGTVVAPTSIVYSVAIAGEVWVRAFAPETALAQVAPGSEVRVLTDSAPGRTYRGRIGYVSPQAEFTPKTVETPELRTQLVYRLRIRVEDADAGLRQGQPVTIRLPAAAGP